MVSRKQVPGFASHVASRTDEHFLWAEGWFTFRGGQLKQQYLADGAGIPAEGQVLISALWKQLQDPREQHRAATGEGQAGC